LLVSSCILLRGQEISSNRAEPPPETKNKTKSFSFKFSVILNAFFVAINVLSSRTGCEASQISIFDKSLPLCPYFVITIPLSIRLFKH
jgi:hypothetical protein